MNHVWTCRCCGKQQTTLPFSFGLEGPDNWQALSEKERERRAAISTDACIIDDAEFYLRGCLEIPVLQCAEPFVWSVWVSLSKRSFDRVGELWDVEIRDNEEPFFGWLCNNIAVYPQTVGLKTNVFLRNSGVRPFIQVEPTDHPLAIDQRNGITLDRVEEIASQVLRHS